MNAPSTAAEKWFEANTFSYEEFSDLQSLRELKMDRGLRVSVCLPTLNERKTLPSIIEIIKKKLVNRAGIVDEIAVIDSGSTDGTCEIANRHGIPVFLHQNVLQSQGTGTGKGEALWKSLHILEGDILVWIDADIINFHPRFVYGLLGPILNNTKIVFTKAFYRRPLRIGDSTIPDAGGRVTELTARPLINLLFPDLAFFVQPLSGEFAILRSVAEQIPFAAGYSVDVAMLIDLVNRNGLESIAQVGMGERIHRNRDLHALSQEAFEISRCLLTRASSGKAQPILVPGALPKLLVQFFNENSALVTREKTVGNKERPPISTLSEYARRHMVSNDSD